jgi:hypothetical protein
MKFLKQILRESVVHKNNKGLGRNRCLNLIHAAWILYLYDKNFTPAGICDYVV